MSEGMVLGFEELVARVGAPTGASRRMIAVAGAPGSGKSTLAERLVERLDAAEPGCAAVLPMDGYHFDDRVLVPLGRRPRKGAPDTFDVGGLAHTLVRLKRNAEDEVAVPVFDRDIEIARAGARLIPHSVRIIVAEGNYLLLDQAPWTALHALFDLTIMVRVPEEELRRRLTARWVGYGLSPAEIAAKLDDNDLPNGRLVAARSIAPDIILAS